MSFQRKRMRTSTGYSFPSMNSVYSSTYSPAQKRAYWASKRFNQLPWSDYGAARIKRGSKYSLANFGKSYKEASAAQKSRRSKFGFTGRGLYTGQGSYFSRMLSRQFNRTMAGKTPLGAAAKRVGRAALQKGTNMLLSGMGEYAVNNDAAGNHLINGMGHSVPTFASAGDETGALTVQHTEYIKDIYGIEFSGDSPTTNMSSDIVVINPGKSESFPWLSQIAANYEEYEIKQLMFCYKSKVSDNLTSSDGQIGSIIMFTEYNANDAMKKTKQQLLQAYGTTNALINTNDVLHGVECDVTKLKGDGHKYIRTENLSTNADKSDYDWAKLQVAVVDTPQQLSNQVVGELYVSYTVILRKPRLFTTLALNLQEDQFYIEIPTFAPDNVGYDNNVKVAAAETNSIGCVMKKVGAGTYDVTYQITFPASFSGDVELIVIGDLGASGAMAAAGTTGLQQTPAKQGNVELIENIPVTEKTTDPSSEAEINASHGHIIQHFRVSQASFGVDNYVQFTFRSPANEVGQLWATVRRYNGHEIDTAPVFKLLTSAGKLDPQDITVPITN